MSEKSILFIGDELGTVTSLTFLKTKTNLLRQKREDKLTIFYWTVNENTKIIKSNKQLIMNCRKCPTRKNTS